MNHSAYFAVAVTVLIALPNVARSLEPSEVFRFAEPSVVVVLASNAKGDKNVQTSGVLIAALDVLTSCKGVADGADIVVTQEGTLRPATVRHADLERDLCQLRMREPLPAARIAQSDTSAPLPQIGDDVYLVSSPRGLDRTFSRVMLSGLRQIPGTSARLLQMDGSPDPGSFGGGVFDQQGRLLGILTPQFRQSGTESFAIPVAWVAELATRAPERTKATAPQAADPASAAGGATQDARWHPTKGDRWTYSMTTGRRNIGTLVVEAVGIGAGQVTERITRPGFASFNVERMMPIGLGSRQLTALTLPGGYVLAELHPYLAQHEIKVGDRWNALPGRFFVPHITQRDFILNAQVMAREKVQTAAGEFDAWRIEAISGAADSGGIETRIRCTWWVSPSMKRSVKMRIKVESPYVGGQSDDVYNLIAFEPGTDL